MGCLLSEKKNGLLQTTKTTNVIQDSGTSKEDSERLLPLVSLYFVNDMTFSYLFLSKTSPANLNREHFWNNDFPIQQFSSWMDKVGFSLLTSIKSSPASLNEFRSIFRADWAENAVTALSFSDLSWFRTGLFSFQESWKWNWAQFFRSPQRIMYLTVLRLHYFSTSNCVVLSDIVEALETFPCDGTCDSYLIFWSPVQRIKL